MPHTILIAGGTGLIGTRLTAMLTEQGHSVRILTRSPRAPHQYAWDPEHGKIDSSALEGVDAVINLAGAGIADARWTDSRKKLLIDSRVQSAKTLQNAISSAQKHPDVYVSASAIGIYGDTGEALQTEDLPVDQAADRPFMVECCDLWEHAADEVAKLHIRTVKIRIGVVLDDKGGALAEIARPIRFGIGGYFGDGKAWYSWIHIDDICRMFIWAIEQSHISGTFNGVAPYPVRNVDFVKSVAKAMHKSALFVPGPAFVMKLALGEMSAVILNSNRVSAEKVQKVGFEFLYPNLDGALAEIYQSA